MPEAEQRSARSYRTHVSLMRPLATSAEEGAQVIQYWANALQSDLHTTMQITAIQLTPANLRYFAAAAQRWFRDAWGRGAGPEHQFPIVRFWVDFHAEYGQTGQILATVNVLTGEVHEEPA